MTRSICATALGALMVTAAMATSTATSTAAPAGGTGAETGAETGASLGFTFAAIDGGTIALDRFRGQPVLVVNTASLCGFTGQYNDLQALHESHGPLGLVVLAVPSDDFSQELDDAAAVKDFCAINFDLTLPMTDITHVKGAHAHPFYQWLADTQGFTPGWNFNKVLLGPRGEVLGTWGATVKPGAQPILSRIEAVLN